MDFRDKLKAAARDLNFNADADKKSREISLSRGDSVKPGDRLNIINQDSGTTETTITIEHIDVDGTIYAAENVFYKFSMFKENDLINEGYVIRKVKD